MKKAVFGEKKSLDNYGKSVIRTGTGTHNHEFRMNDKFEWNFFMFVRVCQKNVHYYQKKTGKVKWVINFSEILSLGESRVLTQSS